MFYPLSFQLPHPNRLNNVILAWTNIPLEGHKMIWESRKMHFEAFFLCYSRWGAPVYSTSEVDKKTHRISCTKFKAKYDYHTASEDAIRGDFAYRYK